MSLAQPRLLTSALIPTCVRLAGFVHAPRTLYSNMIVGAAFEAPWNTYAAGNASGYTNIMSNLMFNTAPSMYVNMSAPSGSPPSNGSASVPLLAVTNRGLGNEGLFFEAGKEYDGYVWVLPSAAAATAAASERGSAASTGVDSDAGKTTYIYIGLHDFTQSPPVVLASTIIALPPAAASAGSVASSSSTAGGLRANPRASGWMKLTFSLTPSAGTSCIGIQPGFDPTVDCGVLPSPAHVCVRCGGEFVVGVVIPEGQSPATAALSAYFGLTMLQPGTWGRVPGVAALASAAATLQAMGVRSIRQGGTYSQTIAWKDWRGPLETRPSMIATWGDSFMGG